MVITKLYTCPYCKFKFTLNKNSKFNKISFYGLYAICPKCSKESYYDMRECDEITY